LADYLLTALLRHDAGLLHADFFESGAWRVRGWSPGEMGPEVVVATTPILTHFRGVLARFGHHYMADQLYGGFIEGQLTQQGRAFTFALYMANDHWRGYWLRAYVRVA
jgi:hypothetical protein